MTIYIMFSLGICRHQTSSLSKRSGVEFSGLSSSCNTDNASFTATVHGFTDKRKKKFCDVKSKAKNRDLAVVLLRGRIDTLYTCWERY